MTKYDLQDRIRNILFVVWVTFLASVVGFYAVVEYLNYRAVKRVEALIIEEREQKALEAKISAVKIQKANETRCAIQQAMIEQAEKEKREELERKKKEGQADQLPSRQEIIEAINGYISTPPAIKVNDSTSITIYMRQ